MLTVTPEAQEKLKAVLASQGSPDTVVRVGVVRGPHGWVHGWRLAVEDRAGPEDTVVRAGDVRVLVEPDLVDLLKGATIDYLEDAANIGFTVEAPNTPPGWMH